MQNVDAPAPPIIPDHEVLRVIGRGSYGEIWLARSLIGSLRAVKVVHRSTFDSDRAFNREFEGMSSFEPISRSHDGFVDILHVGRSATFFYYIMELADDVSGRRPFAPEDYAPKTLRAELLARGRIPVKESIEIGLSVATALVELHRHRLSHRDIKASNIIFVEGRPKLADIGLVAASGQNSFVGTEGYVPPEGPGTPTADVYSLGKVLYEISMGKDRLDFPAVATGLGALADKVELIQLNEVLLKACAADKAKRYATAEALRDDLARLQEGRPPLRRRPRRLLPFTVLFLLLGMAGWAWWSFRAAPDLSPGPVTAMVTTAPPGAMVMLGDKVRHSPATFPDLEPGTYLMRVMLAGFEPVERKVELRTDQQLPTIALTRSNGSLLLESDPAGASFVLRQGDALVREGTTPVTLSDLPTGEYEVAVVDQGRELRQPVQIVRNQLSSKRVVFSAGALNVTSDPPGAEISLDGRAMGRTPLRLETLAGDHRLTATVPGWPPQQREVKVEPRGETAAAFEFSHGSVKITSAPGGAAVYAGETELGRTPLLLEEVKPGTVRYEVRLPGFRPETIEGTVAPNEQSFLAARLEQLLSPEPGQPWRNSLGMTFVTVGAVRFSIWETRVRDYEAFCVATGREMPTLDIAQTPDHPVVKVSHADALAFCEWLTQKELRERLIEESQRYRLPTDLEWSVAAGLTEEKGGTPEERDGKIKGIFPWGKAWPPPAGVGNFNDQAWARPPAARDGFGQTAPVGSFAANEHGLFDLAGNVWEWCAEGYKGSGKSRDWGVLRGGSWANSGRGELQVSYRNVVDRDERDVIYGFRCVLASEP